MPSTSMWLRAAAVAAFATQTAGQGQCYYRNGAKAPSTEKPCSSAEGSACCPDNWQCLDNGLCHYEPGDLYARYSCTDQSWDSPGCPSNLCTYGGNASGGESIAQCPNHGNQWCCDGDATNVDCCEEWPEPRPFFRLQEGDPYATIGTQTASTVPNLATITGLAIGGDSGDDGGSGGKTSAPESSEKPSPTDDPSSDDEPSSTDDPSSDDSSDPTAAPDSVSTTTRTSVTSGSDGLFTVTETIVITPTSKNDPSDTAAAAESDGGGSSSNLGVIIGCAVGIPLALALAGVLLWLMRKRRQQKASSYQQTPEMEGSDTTGSPFMGTGKLGKKRPDTAEIDGNPVGAGRPISDIKGHAELPSGNGFQPGHGTPYGPDTVGLGGGNMHPDRNTWGSVPPQYSPAHNQTAFAHQPEASELDGTSVIPVINEKAETGPQEQPQQYIPYRPPQPVAEMPSVKTPPEDLEKQVQR